MFSRVAGTRNFNATRGRVVTDRSGSNDGTRQAAVSGTRRRNTDRIACRVFLSKTEVSQARNLRVTAGDRLNTRAEGVQVCPVQQNRGSHPRRQTRFRSCRKPVLPTVQPSAIPARPVEPRQAMTALLASLETGCSRSRCTDAVEAIHRLQCLRRQIQPLRLVKKRRLAMKLFSRVPPASLRNWPKLISLPATADRPSPPQGQSVE